MRILITNDDGINSEGLFALVKEFHADNEIVIAAPSGQRSACGHSITINKPIVVREVVFEKLNVKAYSIDGTPADCVKIAIEKLYDNKFDIIISGINFGANLGSDVIYSGTVSAAIEGAIFKIPAIAASIGISKEKIDYDMGAKCIRKIMNIALKNQIENDIVLNINIPSVKADEIKGMRVCELGNRIYTNCYVETMLENNETSFKLEGWPSDIDRENTDVFNYKNNYITITPLHYDLTNYKILKGVGTWFYGED